jgi:crossover junction endodeoxyribonuclease RuvC
MRVLGVDPGLARTGVAVVEGAPGALRLVHAGCIVTEPGTSDAPRLRLLFDSLGAVVRAHRPDAAAVEQLFFASNRTTAMRVGEARGVALCVLAGAGLEVDEYTPMQVKEAVAGYGGASKAQVGRMVRSVLGVERVDGPDDAADACAVAICHHHRARLGRVTGTRSRVAAADGSNTRLAEAVARAQARLAAGRGSR